MGNYVAIPYAVSAFAVAVMTGAVFAAAKAITDRARSAWYAGGAVLAIATLTLFALSIRYALRSFVPEAREPRHFTSFVLVYGAIMVAGYSLGVIMTAALRKLDK